MNFATWCHLASFHLVSKKCNGVTQSKCSGQLHNYCANATLRVQCHTLRHWLVIVLFYFYFLQRTKKLATCMTATVCNAQWTIDRPRLPHPDLCSRTRNVSSPHWFTGRAVVTRPQHPLREGGTRQHPLRQARPPQMVASMTVWEFFLFGGGNF